jgi:hypothetical protein
MLCTMCAEDANRIKEEIMYGQKIETNTGIEREKMSEAEVPEEVPPNVEPDEVPGEDVPELPDDSDRREYLDSPEHRNIEDMTEFPVDDSEKDNEEEEDEEDEDDEEDDEE